MIASSTSKQLSLLFPNASKTMEKLLQHATPEQLETLSQAKDLKAVLTQLMNDTLDTSKSNKIILDILQNSTIFKELGSFPQELKALIQQLQNEAPANSKLEKLLQTFKLSLLDISKIDSLSLKDFINNSGLFLESKLTQKPDPIKAILNSLQSLQSTLIQSQEKGLEPILNKIQNLLQSPPDLTKQSEFQALKNLQKELPPLLESLKTLSKGADLLFSKTLQNLVTKLELFSAPQETSKPFSLSQIQQSMNSIMDELRLSAKAQSKPLLSALTSIATKIEGIIKENPSLALLKTLATHLQDLDLNTLKPDEMKTLQGLIQESKTLSQMKFEAIELLKPEDLNLFFTKLSEALAPLNTTASKSILDIIEKILSSLKQPQQAFEQQGLSKEIKNWISNFEKELSKADPLFSKQLQTQLDKISQLTSTSLESKVLEQSLHKDMKLALLGLEKELGLNPSTHNTELMKSVDKLLMQVEYFQLVSHLSNTPSLYLPFHWEGLENGQLNFKNQKEGCAYCEIDLELKAYGKLNIILQLFDDNQLNMMIYTQKKELQEAFQNNLKSLRSALNSVNIMPRNIRLLELDKQNHDKNPYGNGEKLDELGFEVKG